MKKTIYLMMLVAALTAGQAFAAEPAPGPTLIEGGVDGYYNEWEYDGKYSDQENVSDLKLTVSETGPTQGKNASEVAVYGGLVGGGMNSTNNTILMTGGEVYSLAAASTAWGDGSELSGNKVIFSGGKVFSIAAGENYTEGGTLTGNHAVIAGGHVGGADASSLGHLWGGYSDTGIAAANNTVSLVGNGGSITVDGQKYQGQAITINADISAGTAGGTGNALDIYGKDITLGGGINDTQILNFHLMDGLTSSMLTHNGLSSLSLASITDCRFDGSSVENWSAYAGQEITLIEAYGNQILNVSFTSNEVNITDKEQKVLATAKLELSHDNFYLKLTNITPTTPVPEPTSGSLGLLALCALAVKRRRK